MKIKTGMVVCAFTIMSAAAQGPAPKVATAINELCTRCGACIHVCPNDAIAPGTPIYRINPWLCTECVGFATDPKCVEACPPQAIEQPVTCV